MRGTILRHQQQYNRHLATARPYYKTPEARLFVFRNVRKLYGSECEDPYQAIVAGSRPLCLAGVILRGPNSTCSKKLQWALGVGGS